MLQCNEETFYAKFLGGEIMIVTLLSILACRDKSTDTSTVTEDTSSSVDTTETTDPCAPIEGLDGLGMSGSIVFEDGIEAQGNVRVQMCNSETCFVSKWSDSGFCFPEGTLTANIDYAFDLVPTVDPTIYANPLSFLTPSANIELSEPVVIPLYTHSGPGDQDFDAGNGLIVSTSDSMPETLYAVAVDIDNGGLPFEGMDKENILGAWYIGPFETHLSPATAITFSNSNITTGTTYTVYNGDYENQTWLKTAEITASEDGILESESGLEILSTMLIMQ